MVDRIDIAKAALQELRRAQPNISLCWIAPDGAWDKVLLTAAAQNLRQLVNSPSQTCRAPRRWRPCPASIAGGAGARPDHPDVARSLYRPCRKSHVATAIAAALREVETLEKQRPASSDSRPRFLDS
jgi:hypothetical protein